MGSHFYLLFSNQCVYFCTIFVACGFSAGRQVDVLNERECSNVASVWRRPLRLSPCLGPSVRIEPLCRWMKQLLIHDSVTFAYKYAQTVIKAEKWFSQTQAGGSVTDRGQRLFKHTSMRVYTWGGAALEQWLCRKFPTSNPVGVRKGIQHKHSVRSVCPVHTVLCFPIMANMFSSVLFYNRLFCIVLF